MKSLPWLRIGAKSLAIVASILLAFAIDAWWAGRQAVQEVQGSLLALRTELEGNLRLIDRELAYRNEVIQSIEALNQTMAEDGDLTSDEVDRLLAVAHAWDLGHQHCEERLFSVSAGLQPAEESL